jgi:hypothetical protein
MQYRGMASAAYRDQVRTVADAEKKIEAGYFVDTQEFAGYPLSIYYNDGLKNQFARDRARNPEAEIDQWDLDRMKDGSKQGAAISPAILPDHPRLGTGGTMQFETAAQADGGVWLGSFTWSLTFDEVGRITDWGKTSGLNSPSPTFLQAVQNMQDYIKKQPAATQSQPGR